MLENMKQLACNCRGSANNLALHWMALMASTCSSIGRTVVDLVEMSSGSSVRVAYDKGSRHDSFSTGFGVTFFFQLFENILFIYFLYLKSKYV